MEEYIISKEKVIPYILDKLKWPKELVSNYGRVPVQMGTDTKWADLVCYIPQGSGFVPWIVFEVKQPSIGIEQAVPQAESYSLILGSPFFCVTDGINYEYYFTNQAQGRSIRLKSQPPIPDNIYKSTGLDNVVFSSGIDDLITLFFIGLRDERKFFDDTMSHQEDMIGLYENVFKRLNNLTSDKLKDSIEKNVMMKLPNKRMIFDLIDKDYSKILTALHYIKDFNVDPVLGIEELLNNEQYKMKGAGIFFITQLLAGAHPNKYIVLEENIPKSLRLLGIVDIVVKNDTANGYIFINDICLKLYKSKFEQRLINEGFNIGLPAVHNFLWHYYVYYQHTRKWY